MKKLIFTEHAKDRLRQRRIKKDMVVTVLSSPDYIIKRGDESEAYKKMGVGLLKFVYSEKERFIMIITAYWVNGSEAKDKI